MSDDESDWMRPGAGMPPPPTQPTGGTPPPPPPTGPYLPPDQPAGSGQPAAPGVAGPPSRSVPAGPPPVAPPVEMASPSPSRRRKGVLVAAVATVIAVGGAGTFAATQLAGSNSGGAASAEELGQQVLDSLENEDVLGILDLLMPGERDVFRQPAIDFVSELSRLEVLSPAADLAEIQGVDLSIIGGSVQATDTNVADITNLQLRGEINAEIDGEALPIGDLILDFGDDIDLAELDDSTSSDLDVPLTAVEVDGRWYLSVFFTAAEQARLSSEQPRDIPESGIAPVGGEQPEDALDGLLDAFEQLDLGAVIAALNPGEAAALQRYAPLFVDDAQSMIDEAPIELEIAQAEYTVTGDGSRRHASIDLVVVEGSADGTPFELKYSDGCVTVAADGEEANSCDLDEQLSGEFEQFDDVITEGPVRDLIDVLTEAFADYDQPGVTLVRTDGSWYVSPIGTLFDQLLAVSRALDRSELDAVIEAAPPAAEAVFDDFFGTSEFDIDDPFADDPFADDPFADDTIPDDTIVEDTIPDDTIVDDTIVEDTTVESPLTRCWETLDAIEASTCFQEVVNAGEADAVEAPVEMLHPECGVAEAYWSGFEVADAAFFELIDAARPCFLALVASGELQEFDLPTEYTMPECYEGRNWYQVFDEPEYDERVASCAAS